MSISLPQLRSHFQMPIDVSNEVVPFWTTVGASLGYQYDPFLEHLYNKKQFPELDMEYAPENDLEGYEEYQNHLLYARNADHMASMKRGIEENKTRRDILSQSSFWAQLGAGLFDPINIIALPLGGPALTVGKAAVRGAVGIGALQTGLEAIRYPLDPLATVSESALNIGFAAVAGGLITGAVAVPMARRNAALNRLVDTGNESYNQGIEFSTLGQMTNDEIRLAQSEGSRKKFFNKSRDDLRNESSLNGKTIFGYEKILNKGVFEDGTPVEGNALLNISFKREELINRNKLIDQELAIRRLQDDGAEITDKYNIAAGGWVGSLISNPFKRVLNSKYPDMAKKAIVNLASDSGYSLNLNKLGLSQGPSTYQQAKIMDGEWVSAHADMVELYGKSVTARVKKAGATKDPVLSQDDWYREVLRKRTKGEKAEGAEAEAIEIINKFFKKWEQRLDEVGLIGSKKRIESLVAEGRIKRDRIINEFTKYKNPKARWVEDHNARLNRLDAQLEEWEVTLSAMAEEGFTPVKGEEFLPRYWNKDYIIANREAFAKVLFDWYSKNPYTYDLSSQMKWKRIELKTNDRDIAERVEQTINNILEISDAEDIPNVGAGKSKHLKHRKLDIPNELVWDYMVQDPLAIMKGYTHKTAGKYQFARMNNSKTVHEVLDEIIHNMHVAGKSGKEIDKYRKDYYHLYQRIVTSPMERSPDRWDNRAAFYLKEAAQLNYLGSAGISAIPDFAKIIMEHELGDVIKGLQTILKNTKIVLNAKEARLVGEAIELIQGNSHLRLVDDISNDIRSSSKYDKIKNTFYLANGLAPITQIAKTLDSVIRGHSLIDMSIKLRDGKASKMETEYLARYNIDKPMAIEIANAPWEMTNKGFILPNTKAWENNYQFPKHDAIVVHGPTDSYTKDGRYKGAFYNRKKNTIYFDREYIESTFVSKPWTKPQMAGVKPLPDDAFESPQSWANFVFMHEIMHNKLEPDLKKTSTSAAEYENVINELALEQHNTQPRMTEQTLTTFRTALQSGILNTVLMGTPADKPIITDGVVYIPMSVASKFGMKEHKVVKGYARIESGALGLPFQFYSYALAALSKISMTAAQGQMKNRAFGMSLSLGLGMLAVQIKTPNWAFEEMEWDDWFARGFDQSGIAALYSDLFYSSLQTSLAMGGPNISGGIIKPKFPSEDPYGATVGIFGAGPSIGYDYAEAAKQFFIDGEFGEGAKNFTRSLPFARLWFWKDQMNELTKSFEDWF
jgi:hypothetical protein